MRYSTTYACSTQLYLQWIPFQGKDVAWIFCAGLTCVTNLSNSGQGRSCTPVPHPSAASVPHPSAAAHPAPLPWRAADFCGHQGMGDAWQQLGQHSHMHLVRGCGMLMSERHSQVQRAAVAGSLGKGKLGWASEQFFVAAVSHHLVV